MAQKPARDGSSGISPPGGGPGREKAVFPDADSLFRSFFQASPIGIGFTNDNTLLLANDALCRMTGYTLGELLGSDARKLHCTEAEFDRVRGAFAAGMDKGVVSTLETVWVRRDGTRMDVLVGLAPLDPGDRSRGFTFTAVDITEGRRLERENSEQHQRLLSIFDGIDEPVYVSDPDSFRILYTNQKSRDVWGEPGDLKCFEYLQHRSSPCPFCTNGLIFGEWLGRSYVWEFCNEVNHHWYRCIDKAIRWPDGRMVRYEMAVDVSDRKRAEIEKERLTGELRQARRIEAIGRLAGGVAHDFNNMLQVINTYSELALSRIDASDPLHGQITEIAKAGARSSSLVQQLLAFARKQTIEPRILDLNATISHMMSMLERLIGEDVDLAWVPGEGVLRVSMDPAQIDQILVNLVINARYAIEGNGRILIETCNAVFDEEHCALHEGFLPGRYAQLSVSDNGCGMDESVLENLFEPFYTTRKQGRGTGLGLSTVYGIVSQNSGFINVSSEPGVGSVFRIYLPGRIGADPVPEEHRSARSGGGAETVLLVEDEKAVLRLVRSLLEALGYRVVEASDPLEAVGEAARYPDGIDLLLTDVVMPGLGGRELWEKLVETRPGLRCLFMSGYTANAITHRGVLDEGLHFIQKPFSKDALATKLREVLEA